MSANASLYTVNLNRPLVAVQARHGSLRSCKAFDPSRYCRELVPLVFGAGRVEERSVSGHFGTRVLDEMLATRLLLAIAGYPAAWDWQEVGPGLRPAQSGKSFRCPAQNFLVD